MGTAAAFGVGFKLPDLGKNPLYLCSSSLRFVRSDVSGNGVKIGKHRLRPD